ncbi:MAG: DUF302 domain-containing protein [Sedimentisphaerales bacterium]|nr:DUF302 domain-containing protein [Sedimentisphaerales bacterium]
MTNEDSLQQDKKAKRKGGTYFLIGGLTGLAAGAIVCGLVIFTTMPSLMIVTHESELGFDETVAALEKSIANEGWVVSAVSDMNRSMAKHGVEFGPRVKLVKLCKPEYAKSVLTTDRHISTLMPCSFAVWESDNGTVHLSKMNMGLMAKMFGGNIARVMGGSVVRDEKAMLAGIIKK